MIKNHKLHSGIFFPLLSVLLVIFSSSASAQGLGVLFTEPEEREYMDFLRDEFVRNSQLATFNINEDVIPDIPVEVVTESDEPQILSYKFGGLMTRINGSRMVWLNNRQVPESDLPGNISIQNTASGYLLNIRANGSTYSLKAGQSIDISDGEIIDAFEETDADASNAVGTNVQAEQPPVEPAQVLAATEAVNGQNEANEEIDVTQDNAAAASALSDSPEIQEQLQSILNRGGDGNETQ